jgi:hypothetical protein
VKIFSGVPETVERDVNEWIKNAKPTVLLEEVKKDKRLHVVHAHCVGLREHLCIVIFYETPEEV